MNYEEVTVYDHMKEIIKSKFDNERIRFVDYDQGNNAYYVRFIYKSTIYICEKRFIGSSVKFYKMEGVD